MVPINLQYLDHPLLTTQEEVSTSKDEYQLNPAEIKSLNTSEGYVEDVIDSIVDHRLSNKTKKSTKVALFRLKTTKETLMTCKKVTAGIFSLVEIHT